MKNLGAAILIAFLISTAVSAGKVTGSFSEGGKPVPKGLKVEVVCGDNTVAAQTDDYGAFSLFVADKGKCNLKVTHQGQTPTYEITSYDGSVAYDLVLEKVDGKYTLKRK